MNNLNKTLYSGWAFKLIIINVIVFFIQVFTAQYRMTSFIQGGTSVLTYYLGLTPDLIAQKGYIWQIFTYMFLHDTGTFFHLFFNMYALLIFGTVVEQEWGEKRFLIYYFFCGAFAGISIFLVNYFHQGLGYFIPTIGASGAIFGLLLAFGILFPNAELLLFFIMPIKAKYLVILYAGIELILEFSGGNSSISHIGHLGGLAGGLIFFLFIKKRALEFKIKKIKAAKAKTLLKQEISAHREPENKMDINNHVLQINILKKLRDSGFDSLNDDEIQYIKYVEIMMEDFDNSRLCNEVDLDIDDEHCKNCEYLKGCFIREVRKYTGK